MTNVYPNAIRTFPPHKDGRDYVLAADVNEIQDELTGVETALGAKPNVYTNAAGKTATYTDVVTRLNAMQQYDDQMTTTVNSLVDASQTGWDLPAGTIRASGTSIPPTVNNLSVNDPTSDWHPVTWNVPISWTPLYVLGPGGGIPGPPMFPPSDQSITCQKTGWWIINMRIMAEIASGPSNLDHMCYARMYLSDHGIDMSTGESTNPRGTHAYHRISLTYAGEWYQGEKLQLQIRHMDSLRVDNRQKYPNPVPNINVWGWTAITYIRALPNAYTTRPPQDLDPQYPY